jgi:hypothetical protein
LGAQETREREKEIERDREKERQCEREGSGGGGEKQRGGEKLPSGRAIGCRLEAGLR